MRARLPLLLFSWLLTSLAAQASAQPVDTAAQAIRLTTGVETVSRHDEDNDERVNDLRFLLDVSHRVLSDLDLGVSLPSATVAPDFALANPWLYGTYHLMHKPLWMGVSLSVEPPLLVNLYWRSGIAYEINISFLDQFEWVNGIGARIAILNTEDRYLDYGSALVWKPIEQLGFGPQIYVRYDQGGIDNYGFGARARWHITYHGKTLAAVFLKFTTPSVRFRLDEMTLTLVATWFYHL